MILKKCFWQQRKILLKNHVVELLSTWTKKDKFKRSVDDFVDFLKNCNSCFRAISREKQKNTFKEYLKYIATYTSILIDHLRMVQKHEFGRRIAEVIVSK